MQRPNHRIVVIGATGYTGRLVAAGLARQASAPGTDPERAAGSGTAGEDLPTVVLAGRDPGKVDELVRDIGGRAEAARVDVKDPASLAALIRTGDSVINCAGPFTELGEPVVARCVEAGAAYVDTTGEQPWMQEMRERYHEPAVQAGVPVVNGMAFEWALGDCAAAVLAARLSGGLHALDVIYAWGGTASSRGTRRTSLRIVGTRAWEIEDGRWHRRPAASATRRVTFGEGRERWAVAFGAGEVVTVPRWADVETARGWLVMGRRNARLARLFSPALPFIVPLLRPALEPLATRQADPTPEERADSHFTIRLEGASAGGDTAALEVRGTDPYGLTAAIAVAGARRALAADSPAGVLAPSQLLDPAAFFRELAPLGVRLVPER